jgi:hypothetical protein
MQITSRLQTVGKELGQRASFKAHGLHIGAEAVQTLGNRSWLRCGLGFVAHLAMLIDDANRDGAQRHIDSGEVRHSSSPSSRDYESRETAPRATGPARSPMLKAVVDDRRV